MIQPEQNAMRLNSFGWKRTKMVSFRNHCIIFICHMQEGNRKKSEKTLKKQAVFSIYTEKRGLQNGYRMKRYE